LMKYSCVAHVSCNATERSVEKPRLNDEVGQGVAVALHSAIGGSCSFKALCNKAVEQNSAFN
jgi:hypothetical protein